jgi:hypothetical protein
MILHAGSTSALSLNQVQVTSTMLDERNSLREKNIIQILSSSIFRIWTRESLIISIDHDLIEPRGRMQGPRITLSSAVVREGEFIQLFLHEFAHFFDIYILRANKNTLDPSLDFYSVSWENPTTKHAWQKQRSFVSGYAATNQYEDFAESFVMYVFHNRSFEDLALRDDTLRQKYLFFRNYVFSEGTFVDTDFSIGKVPSYLWDTTKLPISLQKYLYSLN